MANYSISIPENKGPVKIEYVLFSLIFFKLFLQVCAVLHDDWVYLIDGETASRFWPTHWKLSIHLDFCLLMSGTAFQRGFLRICRHQLKIFLK